MKTAPPMKSRVNRVLKLVQERGWDPHATSYAALVRGIPWCGRKTATAFKKLYPITKGEQNA